MYIQRAHEVLSLSKKIPGVLNFGHIQDLLHQFDFPFNIYKNVANANSKQHLSLDWDNNMDRGRGKSWIQIT